MKIFECKCGSKEIFIKENGNNKGLYCAECGKWIQWLGKDDLRLAERQIEQSIINPIPRNLDELKEHDKKIIKETLEKLLNTPMDNFNGNSLKEVYEYDSNGVFDAGWAGCYENFCEVIEYLWQITID